MIISQTVGLEPSDVHKPSYFGEIMPSPLSLTASIPSVGHNTLSGASQGLYPPSDGYYIPGRVQADLPNMNMYGSQSESLAISSPGNYIPNPASVTAAPGLMGSHYAASGLQHPPCYSSLGDEYEMRSAVGGVWHGGYAQPPPSCYPYENNFNHQYPYDRYCGMDINDGVRRKNATRESTNTLKAWLQEHKKNPYPTKGEKIMLAIITKMTLTQVSTWFANARRRLKKENKMTWVPKNRSSDSNNNSSKKGEDDDDDISQHSQDNDCKSDVDHSIDSDDSDTRKVTSTNSNDEITTTTDFKPCPDFSNDQSSLVSDPTRIQEINGFSAQPSDGHIQQNYNSFDEKEKNWPTGQDKIDHKPNGEMTTNTLVGGSSQFTNNPYVAAGIRDNISLGTSSIKKTEEPSIASDNKYSVRGWNTSAYQYSSRISRASQDVLPKQSEEVETLTTQSPAADGSNIKPDILQNNCSINSKTETCATSPSISSPYIHGYNSQQPIFHHAVDYYRHVERPSIDSTSYYPQIDLNGQVELKQDQIQGNYSVGGNKLQSKNTIIPPLTAPSLTATESLATDHIYQPQHMSPNFYSSMKLNKPTDPTSASFTNAFYPHNFHQIQSSTSPSNLEYYQRKNFYSPDASSYHSPASSPRK